MKVLITGVRGFVGSHLKSFLKQNKFEIFGLCRNKKNEHLDMT